MKKRPIRKQDSKFQLHEVIKHRKIESLKTTTADSKITVQLSKKNYFIIFSVFALILCIFLIKIANIQISGHSDYRKQSIKNISNRKILFANRGLILDRNDKILAYNEDTDDRDYGIRKYSEENLFILGDVRYPKKDGNGNYYVSDIEGLYGIEKRFDNYLKGENGFFVNQNFAEKQKKLTHFVDEAKDGEDIQLTIDSVMQKSVYENIKKNANKFGFKSATAIIMDINTGEILVNADYVNKNINKIPDYGLYRSISGLFTPGSTVKPFFALAALEEDIISPQETVYSSGKLLLENKYDPENPSVFLDWKAHGLVNLREAIASSSNIYFYHIGGGYKNRKGLGIDKLFRYATLFGFGIPTNTDIAVEPTGVVPNPKWKQENFNDFWRVGDTYNTVIGQYNFLVTPLQIVRATEPKILFGRKSKTEVGSTAISVLVGIPKPKSVAYRKSLSIPNPFLFLYPPPM